MGAGQCREVQIANADCNSKGPGVGSCCRSGLIDSGDAKRPACGQVYCKGESGAQTRDGSHPSRGGTDCLCSRACRTLNSGFSQGCGFKFGNDDLESDEGDEVGRGGDGKQRPVKPGFLQQESCKE